VCVVVVVGLPVKHGSFMTAFETVYREGVFQFFDKNFIFIFRTILLCPINPLTPELNPSTQRCLTRYFAGDFAS
jgi:hypothetical protein